MATRYNNLGSAWHAKGEYDRAIVFYEKCQAILILFFEPKHPYLVTNAQNLSLAANERGMQLFRENQYAAALPYFQKAFTNAEASEDGAFSLTCLNNLGSMHKRLGQHAEGLATLEKGIARAEELDKKSGQPQNAVIHRRMRYHALDCLAGLGRKKEAEQRAALLYPEALEAKDERTVEDLKKDGWVK